MTNNQNTTAFFDLIRHGEPAGGPMFRGSKDDPLSDTGWQQMNAAIRDDDQWDVIITSPLLRCRIFAEQLAEQRQIPLHQEPRLREIAFGDWEGRTSENIMADTPEALTRFWSDPVRYPPPGGEAITEFRQRVSSAWQDWQTQAAGKRVLVVCHGGVIRMLLAEVMGIPTERSFSALTVPYACRSRIRVDLSEHGLLSCLQTHGG
ncbi:histidine phosphatase family protein [Marinobacter sp.]|jgi:alpha-ribazole phosphatase|uniref:histidine phosphatase family protein n=1 Tax=Marinobacter sp. TaxID=50741 RepID=UPI000C45C84C|nr:alpha-ribazole phosphatase family protein [Marinobacter sp.]MBE93847.1 histidine phosphatase family protein [Marinobacter sp.]